MEYRSRNGIQESAVRYTLVLVIAKNLWRLASFIRFLSSLVLYKMDKQKVIIPNKPSMFLGRIDSVEEDRGECSFITNDRAGEDERKIFPGTRCFLESVRGVCNVGEVF